MIARLAYLLLIAALAVVAVVMGSHGAAPAGHATAASATAAEHALDASHQHSGTVTEARVTSAPESDRVGDLCAGCTGDHSGLLMACAFLALLLVVTFVLPALALRLGIAPPAVVQHARPTRGAVLVRPPDLAELCISRQ